LLLNAKLRLFDEEIIFRVYLTDITYRFMYGGEACLAGFQVLLAAVFIYLHGCSGGFLCNDGMLSRKLAFEMKEIPCRYRHHPVYFYCRPAFSKSVCYHPQDIFVIQVFARQQKFFIYNVAIHQEYLGPGNIPDIYISIHTGSIERDALEDGLKELHASIADISKSQDDRRKNDYSIKTFGGTPPYLSFTIVFADSIVRVLF